MIVFIRKRWVLCLALIFALVCVSVYRPALNSFREWRADKLLEKANEYGALGDWNEVGRAALASGQLKPSLESASLYFQAQKNSKNPRVLRAAATLALYPGVGEDDLAGALAAFLDARDLINFTLILHTLSDEKLAFSKVRFEILRFFLMSGKASAAIRLADALPESERVPKFDLLLARELLGTSQKELYEDVASRLSGLLDHEQDTVALAALGILATQPDSRIRPDLAKKAVTRFGSQPDLSSRESLALALLKLGLEENSESRRAIVEQAILENEDENLERLLHWLLRISAPAEVVRLTDRAKMTPTLMQHRSSALIALGQLEQLWEELKSPPPGLRSVELHVSQAVVAHLMGRTSKELHHWQSAFKFASLKPAENYFFRIAMAARGVGATDQQMEALARGIEHPLGVPPESNQLAELISWLAKRDTKRLLSLCRKLLLQEPGNPSLINNYHYLTTLHGSPDASTVSTLKALVASFPNSLHFRGSLAFAQLKTDNAAAAIETLAREGQRPDALPNTERAVYATALAKLGRADEAAELRQSIDWGALNAGEAEALGGN